MLLVFVLRSAEDDKEAECDAPDAGGVFANDVLLQKSLERDLVSVVQLATRSKKCPLRVFVPGIRTEETRALGKYAKHVSNHEG